MPEETGSVVGFLSDLLICGEVKERRKGIE